MPQSGFKIAKRLLLRQDGKDFLKITQFTTLTHKVISET